MANILLATFIVVVAAAWRYSGYWTPWSTATAPSRSRLLVVAGSLIALLTTGFSVGDVLGGRTQISRNPVRYASRLQGAEAHHHDLRDSTRYWRQITLQTAVGLIVAGSLILLGRPAQARRRAQA